MNLKRYNLGFGFFGSLEQCADGDLMLADEAIAEIETHKRHLDETVELYLQHRELYEELNNLFDKRKKQLSDEMNKNTKLSVALYLAVATAVIEAGILVFAVWG